MNNFPIITDENADNSSWEATLFEVFRPRNTLWPILYVKGHLNERFVREIDIFVQLVII